MRRVPLLRQLPVLNAMGLVGVFTQPRPTISVILGVVAFVPEDIGVALEGQDVGTDAVQEPAIMTDDDQAAAELHEGIFEGAQGIDIQVVGGLIEDDQVGAAFEQAGQMHAVALATGQRAHFALLLVALEVEARAIGAAVDLHPARLLDLKGSEVQYERERGIYDHDTHSDELRFAPVQGKTPVKFSWAEGTIMLRYPVRMKTLSLKTGFSALAGLEFTIDGPFVSWIGKEQTLPEVASFTPIEQWRAFDASGRRLKKHPYKGFSMSKGVTTETYTYWGEVKEVRVDVVEEWAEVKIDYSLPSIDPLPAHRVGTAPKTDEVKATPGGEVTMQVVPAKSVPAGAEVAVMSKEDAITQLKELGFRRFDANSFVLAATSGRADALRLFIAGGMPVDTESGGRTALMSAAMMGHVEAGKVLIEAGADVNKPDVTGSPPLLRLVMKCNATELVQAFIDTGADLNVEGAGCSNVAS